jgi:hypothetical protein
LPIIITIPFSGATIKQPSSREQLINIVMLISAVKTYDQGECVCLALRGYTNTTMLGFLPMA